MKNIILFSISVLAVVVMAFSNFGSTYVRVGNTVKSEVSGILEIVQNTVDVDDSILYHEQNIATIRPIRPKMLLPNITLTMHR